METWQTVVSYEGKLVRRNWLFSLRRGSTRVCVGFSYPVGHSSGWWSRIVFASSIPMRESIF
ncbi:MAG: hypothetical protein ACLTZT_08415 [Butyricimonas faecalis]